MKGRESGMPERQAWEKFFNPEKILKTLGVDEKIRDAAEFGCGYGTFTIPAAKLIQGTMYAMDIDEPMLKITEESLASFIGIMTPRHPADLPWI